MFSSRREPWHKCSLGTSGVHHSALHRCSRCNYMLLLLVPALKDKKRWRLLDFCKANQRRIQCEIWRAAWTAATCWKKHTFTWSTTLSPGLHWAGVRLQVKPCTSQPSHCASCIFNFYFLCSLFSTSFSGKAASGPMLGLVSCPVSFAQKTELKTLLRNLSLFRTCQHCVSNLRPALPSASF